MVAGADGADGGELRTTRCSTDNEAFRDVAAKVGRVGCGPFQRVFGGEPVRKGGQQDGVAVCDYGAAA